MAKAKIDLKARLGRRNVGVPGAGASIPPPAGVNPSAAPGAWSRSAPAPASGGAPSPRMPGAEVGRIEAPRAPSVDFATATLDDAELAQVRRGGARKTIAVAVAAAVVGGVLGHTIGGLRERDRVAQLAVAGAGALLKEVETSNAEIAKMSGVLSEAAATLKKGQYPEKAVKALADINIPFDGTNLSGKHTGRFKPRVVNQLIAYAGATTRANRQKDKLRSLLLVAKGGIEELIAQRDKPKVRWGVYVQQGPAGPWGNMTRLPEPFEVGGRRASWPGSFNLKEGKRTYTLPRYQGGDPMRGKRRRPDVKLIPIAPATEGAVCQNDIILRVRRELAEMLRTVEGDATPGREAPGLTAMGKAIQDELRKIGG